MSKEPRTDVAWDGVSVVKFPSRAAFAALESGDPAQRLHSENEPLSRHIGVAATPMRFPESNDVPWDQVPNPPRPDDGPVTVVHVIRFKDTPSSKYIPNDMKAYQSTASIVATEQGIRISGWFAIEGAYRHDSRPWHQIRFNSFPSAKAFRAVVREPARLNAERNHRDAAIADTYTVMVRCSVNTLRESTGN